MSGKFENTCQLEHPEDLENLLKAGGSFIFFSNLSDDHSLIDQRIFRGYDICFVNRSLSEEREVIGKDGKNINMTFMNLQVSLSSIFFILDPRRIS